MSKTLTLIFILIQHQLLAQVFSGSVVEADSGTPVSYAAIYVEETQSGTIADAAGQFSIDVSVLTKMTLQISAMGFHTRIEHVDIKKLTENIFTLEKSHLQLDEVIVAVPGGKLGSENVVSIEQQSMVDLSFSSPPTLVAAISQIPGVEQVSTGAGIGKPVIRGLTGNRIVVYSQNTRLENQQFGGEHGLGEDALGVERVEVVKGPASLLYGADALGGVLYLVDERYTSEGQVEGFVASGYSTNTAGIKSTLGLKLNKSHVKWNLFGGYANHADYQVPGEQRVYNTRFDNLSIKSALGYHRKNWVGNLRYSLLNNKIGIPESAIYTSDIERGTELPYQHIQQHILTLENIFYLGENEINAIIGYTTNRRKEYEEHDEHMDGENPSAHDAHAEGEAALDMRLNTLTYNFKSKFELASHTTFLTVGVQGLYQTNVNFGEELLIPDATMQDAGAYAMVNHSTADDMEIQGGLRLDLRSIDTKLMVTDEKTIPALQKNFSSINGSLGMSKNWGEYTLKANLASGFRPPTTAELLSEGVHHGSLRYERGNANLESERAVQLDATLEIGSDHFHIGLSPFYNYIHQYIYLQPTLELVEGYRVFDYQQTNARLYGGEISLHYHPHQIHWLHMEGSFSSVRAENTLGQPLPLIPSNRLNGKIKAALDREGKLQFKNIFLECVYKFAQDRVSAEETPTASYALLHAGINIETPFTKGGLVWQLGVNNLLNTEYTDHLSRLKTMDINNAGRNFSFSVRWNWQG